MVISFLVFLGCIDPSIHLFHKIRVHRGRDTGLSGWVGLGFVFWGVGSLYIGPVLVCFISFHSIPHVRLSLSFLDTS